MKMSDVFSLPMEVGSSLNNVGTAYTELTVSDFYLADFRRENTHEEAHLMAKTAAHAINQHDALVSMNAELVEALELVTGVVDLYGIETLKLDLSDPSSGRAKVQKLLEKAKELNHER